MRVRDLIAAKVYYLLYFLLLPVTALGHLIWVGKAISAGRGSGASGTAQGPLSARFFEHSLGTREDEAAYPVRRTRSGGMMNGSKDDMTDGGLPKGLAGPAKRALAAAGYSRLEQLARVRESDIRRLHGMGPKVIGQLRAELAARGWSFADEATR